LSFDEVLRLTGFGFALAAVRAVASGGVGAWVHCKQSGGAQLGRCLVIHTGGRAPP